MTIPYPPGAFPSTPSADDRIDDARQGLDDKLAEIGRRVQATTESLDPARLLENPWLRAGAALAAGFVTGYGRDSAILRTGVRLILVAGVRRILNEAFDRDR